jgi:hypothetical protein
LNKVHEVIDLTNSPTENRLHLTKINPNSDLLKLNLKLKNPLNLKKNKIYKSYQHYLRKLNKQDCHSESSSSDSEDYDKQVNELITRNRFNNVESTLPNIFNPNPVYNLISARYNISELRNTHSSSELDNIFEYSVISCFGPPTNLHTEIRQAARGYRIPV